MAWGAILLKNEVAARKPLSNFLVTLAGVFLALLHILFGSVMCNLLVHEPILPPNHDLGRKFDCFFKHGGGNSSSDLRRIVCTLSSSTAMVDSSDKITRNKEIPRLRASV